MGSPYPFDTVEPSAISSSRSRSGPVFELGDGAAHPVMSGKYNHGMDSSLSHKLLDSSNPPRNACSHQTYHRPPHPSPGRTPASIKEAPSLPSTVESDLTAALLLQRPCQSVSCRRSRPGPVSVALEGVFQPAIPGKYPSSEQLSVPDVRSNSSCNIDSVTVSDESSRRTPDSCDPASTIPISNHFNNNGGRSQPQHFLSVYYQNVRGLRTKTNELKLALSSCDYDMVILTETWLRPDVSDAELTSDYSLFRCDRSESTSNLLRGGGVLIAVKNTLHCTAVSVANCERIEQVSVCLKLPHRSIYIFGIYLRPNSDPGLYASHASSVQKICDRTSENDLVLLLGDYNLPHLQWNFDEDVNGYLPSNASSESELVLAESIYACGLVQMNSITNRNDRLLDLVFVDSPDDIEIFQPPLPLMNMDAHHVPFVVQVDTHCCFQDRVDSQFVMDFDFRRCDFASLNVVLSSIDWESHLQGDSVDANVLLFYDKLHDILQANVPRRRRALNSVNRKPWWTPELRNLRNRLRKARKRFFVSKTEENRDFLRLAETTYNDHLASSHHDYLLRTQSSIKQNPSMFWKFVKAQRSNNRVPSNVSFESTTASTPEEAANLFSIFFQSVFSSTSPQVHPNSFQNIPAHDVYLPALMFSREEIRKALENLDVSKGAGVDGLSPYLLKMCAESLVTPLTQLFNRSIEERTFPWLWKTASMIPIHKSGSLHRVENYRGISILCCLGKILESLVHEVILTAAKPLISDYQHGFVPRRSTTTNLMCYTSSLFREIERRNQVDSIYVDFSKAFDTVPHAYAVAKLKHMGFPEWITEWLTSYLTGRKAFVQVNSVRSEVFDIPSGVPQGSVLGPLIFVLFINDLCHRMSSGKLLYADDLKIFRVIRSSLDCAALQMDIDILSQWCNENGMSVNINKCKLITFSRSMSPINHVYSINASPLERVQTIRDLGVIFDSKLRFNEHIATTTAKGFSVLGFIRRNASQFTDVYALKALFCALVRSILEYASPIWAPYHAAQVIRIERVQKQFLRFALRHLPWNDPVHLPDYAARCQLIDLQLLSVRRLQTRRLFIFDLITNNIDCPDLLAQVSFNVPQRQLRNSALITVPRHRTGYGYNNPFSSCLRVFNNVSDCFDFSVTKNCFKNSIKNLA